MKKIVVTSDSHSKAANLYYIYKMHKDADMFIHLGDYVRDADMSIQRLGINVICIKANGDIGSMLPVKKIINFEGKKIIAVHGHIEGVKWSLIRLKFMAHEEEADIVLFGHTHNPLIENTGTLFVNPGYAYSGQYSIVTINRGSVNAELLKL